MGRTPSNKIVDAGVEKNVPCNIMEPKHVTDFREKINELNKLEMLMERHKLLQGDLDKYKELVSLKSRVLPCVETKNQEFVRACQLNPKYISDNEVIADIMGITPFYPSVMINISPNWKGRFSNYKGTPLQDAFDVKHFKYVIEKYLNSNNRYSKWKYCLECGSEGNFLHAHIVAEINPKTYKSVITHINKGNHAVELRKAWNATQVEGIGGLLKGKYAIQRVMIRNREILNDKLNYLIEKNKPEGHQNLTDLNMVFGDFNLLLK